MFKFPNAKTIKITFTTQSMAIRCIENGIHILNLHVPPRNITIDSFIEVRACYRCYKLDDHISTTCDKNSDYLICSVCAGLGHNFRNCTAERRCCINCGGQHSTMSMTCPIRKKIIDEKRKLNNKTYVKVAMDGSHMSTNNRSAAIQLKSGLIAADNSPDMSEVINRSTACVIIATMKENEMKGTFEKVLNELLAANGLYSFNMGGVSPPVVTPATRDFSVIRPPSVDAVPREDTQVACSSNDMSSSSSPVSPTKAITVYKKRGQLKVTAENIKKLVVENKIVVESQLCISDCERLMKADPEVINVVELAVSRFNEKLSASSIKKPVTPATSNIARVN